MSYSFRLAARVLLYAPSHRQDRTYHGLCYTSGVITIIIIIIIIIISISISIVKEKKKIKLSMDRNC